MSWIVNTTSTSRSLVSAYNEPILEEFVATEIGAEIEDM